MSKPWHAEAAWALGCYCLEAAGFGVQLKVQGNYSTFTIDTYSPISNLLLGGDLEGL